MWAATQGIFFMSHENQPFRTLKSPRTISRTDLPEELHTFYQTHEGSGLESSPDVPLRICKLDEAEKIGISDIDLLGGEILEGRGLPFHGAPAATLFYSLDSSHSWLSIL
jgi:hypothetical protein